MSPTVGHPITLVIRPEAVIVVPGRVNQASVSINCEVMQALYNGSTTLYALRSPSTGIELTARNAEQANCRITLGAMVEVSLLVERAVAVDA